MSKAVEGAALLGGALAMGVAAFFDPVLIASPLYDKAMEALVLGGISMETAAIAGALTANRGMNITTRQAAAYRQIVYGQQRVGGIMIYQSTTGSSNDQWNAVIVLAGHDIDSIQNLYLNGNQVHWLGSGVGWSVRNGVGFGGIADGNTYTGATGQQYNYGGTGHSGLYCEARYGDQAVGDVIGGLTANDPNWAADGHGNSPYVGGCAYIYLKIEYNSSLFPSFPEIRITVNGKNNIYDPRTGTYGFTSNWALICADVLTDTTYGLGDNTVNQAQLIAAANVCDEQVEVGALSTSTPSYESRYTTNWHYDTGVGSGDALAAMMPGAQGRLSRIGGEWYIWPAYWQGPSYSFDANALIAAPSWKPYRSTRDLFNRILGTYIAPSYPYNCVGNLYDSNGFYQQTQIQDNFPYAFQSTNYPEYACDTLHGYASDQYLTADGERKLPKEICYQTVLSITQAQRCSKIALLRNRQQGSGSLEMALGAYKMQPCDVMLFTFPQVGWSDKMLEIVGTSFKINSEDGQDGQKALSISTTINVVETEASVYEWSTTEELTVYDVPSTPTQQSSTPAPPTNMSLTSGAGTALIAPDGSLQSRIEVQWDTPLDVLATGIVVQYQAAPGGVATGAWMDAGTVSSALNLAYISGAVAGQTYNVRIASIRSNGVMSTWDEIDGYTVTLTLSSSTGLYRVGLGSLSGVAYPSAGAAIICNPFTAYLGQLQLPIFPGGAVTIGGLTQQTFYYVYYVDPVNAGGNVAPVATTNIADFLGKPGYWLIDSIVTPFAATGMASRYYPITSSDMGAASTLNITAAYDGNLSTYATMTAAWAGGSSPVAQCMAQFHFGAIILTTAATLTVVAACSNAGLFEVVAGWPVGTGYVDSTVMNATVVSGATTYTLTVPAGTNISNVTVIVQAGNSGNIGSGGLLGSGQVFELYIQT